MKLERIIVILLIFVVGFQIFQYMTRDNYKREFLIEQNKKLELRMSDIHKAIDLIELNIIQVDTTIYRTKNIYNEKEKEIYIIKDSNVLRDSIRSVMARLDRARFD